MQHYSSLQDQRQELVSIRDFLNHVFANISGENYLEVTLILPPELQDGRPSPITYSYHIGHDQPNWTQIHTLNSEGFGVYYGICPKRARRQTGRAHELDASYCSMLWADIDLKDGVYSTKQEAYQAIIDLDVPATAIIDSGGGLHALWRISPVKVDSTTLPHLKQTLRGLAIALRADTSVCETARVLRLPNTINTKPERNGAMCTVIDFLDGQIDYSYFEDYHDLAAPATRKIARDIPRYKPENLPAFIAAYMNTSHPQGGRNHALNAAAYYMSSNGYSEGEALDLLLQRAVADELSEREATNTIKSAYRATPGTPSYVTKKSRIRMAAGDVLKRVKGGNNG